LFAAAKQLVGADVAEVEMAAPATVADLRTALRSQYPQLCDVERHLMFAVNTRYASDESPVEAEAEIACIPPVSGG
jgi:molybdopterin converting factor subunit 1